MAVSYGKLKNNRITKTYPEIRLPYFVDTNSSLYKQQKRYHPGIDLFCTTVYNFCCGVVMYIGHEDTGFKDITIQYNDNTIVRYKHLKSIVVDIGYVLEAGVQLGIADKYVHFEYCVRNSNNKEFPVRIWDIVYYKQDPKTILDDPISLPMSNITLVEYTNGEPFDFEFSFSSVEQAAELGNDQSDGSSVGYG